MTSYWKLKLLVFICLTFISGLAFAGETLAPLLGFAHTFLFNAPIPNAEITILETGQSTTTHSNGEFGPIWYPVGKSLTLQFKKSGFKTTQSGTVIMPAEGLTGPYNQITFQIPANETFAIFAKLVGAKLDKDSCHVASTVTQFHKTLNDIPQGEKGAQVVLTPDVGVKPFYFDIFKSGIFKDKTNPLTRHLQATSEDGGVGYFNLPPRKEPYVITAIKEGKSFTSASFVCRKGVFINISPPRGPSVIS